MVTYLTIILVTNIFTGEGYKMQLPLPTTARLPQFINNLPSDITQCTGAIDCHNLVLESITIKELLISPNSRSSTMDKTDTPATTDTVNMTFPVHFHNIIALEDWKADITCQTNKEGVNPGPYEPILSSKAGSQSSHSAIKDL
jgi:hypothetical protein